MDCYSTPDGADTGGVCPPVPLYNGVCLPVGLQLPVTPAPLQAAAAGGAEGDMVDDMELLERIMRECHLYDPAAPPAPEPDARPQQGAPPQAGAARAPQASAPVAQAPQAISVHAAAPAALAPWAQEMVQRLQGCASEEDASARCAEMLATFQQHAGAQPERLRMLQSANSVLLRGLRNLNQRHRDQTAKMQQAEHANAQLAAELERCQEALRASERARGQLQYHLQVMSVAPGTAAGGM